MIYILEESVMIYFPKKYLVTYVVEFFLKITGYRYGI